MPYRRVETETLEMLVEDGCLRATFAPDRVELCAGERVLRIDAASASRMFVALGRELAIWLERGDVVERAFSVAPAARSLAPLARRLGATRLVPTAPAIELGADLLIGELPDRLAIYKRRMFLTHVRLVMTVFADGRVVT